LTGFVRICPEDFLRKSKIPVLSRIVCERLRIVRRAPAGRRRVESKPQYSIAISLDLRKLNEAEAASLVHFLEEGDALTGPIIMWEIERRLLETKSTALAVRYLLPRDETDMEDAFDGLTAIGFKAKQRLFIPAPRGESVFHEGQFHETQNFVRCVILKLLQPWVNRSPREIIAAALSCKFRYLGRIVRLRMIDEIRHRRVLERKGVRGGGYELALTVSELDSLAQVIEIAVADEDKYRAKFGDANWETLFYLADLSRNENETTRAWNSRVTLAIAEKRAVKPRQARKLKRQLCRMIHG
jgi:hypothetical protein